MLCERRDLLVTPETLPPGSPTSSIATSPRLSLDSLPSWRSSRTSNLSLSMGGPVVGEDVKSPAFGGVLLKDSKTAGSGGIVEDWNLELGSLPVDYERLLSSEDEDERIGKETSHGEDGDERIGKETSHGQDDDDEAMDMDMDMDTQDEAFRRLSHLLASLQAQAQAAVSNPSTPLKDDDIPGDDDDAEYVSEYRFQAISPTSSTVFKSNNKKRGSLRESDFQCLSSRPDNLLRASFRRSNSLPYATASLVSIPDSLHHENRRSRHPISVEVTSAGTETGEHTPLSPGHHHHHQQHIECTGCSALHRRATSASTPFLALPGQKRWSHRSALSSPPTPSGLSTALPSGCSSPGSLSRRGSYLIRDMRLEALVGELIEIGDRANKTVLENQGFMVWVWVMLTGGGLVWAIVGWVLRWGCRCEVCPS